MRVGCRHPHSAVPLVRAVWRGGSESIPQVFGKPLAEPEKQWLATLAKPVDPTRTLIYRNWE